MKAELVAGRRHRSAMWLPVLLALVLPILVATAPSSAQGDPEGGAGGEPVDGEPSIKIEPTDTIAGDTITVIGAGFDPNESLWVRSFESGDCGFGEYSEFNANDEGAFDHRFDLPSDLEPQSLEIAVCWQVAEFTYPERTATLNISPRDPSINIVLTSPDDVDLERVPRGTELDFSVIVEDANEERLSLLWVPGWPTGEEQEGPDQTFTVDTANGLALGSQRIEVGMFEGEEFLEFDELDFTIVNQPPTVSLACPSPVSIGDEVLLTTDSLADPDGAEPSVGWIIDGQDGGSESFVLVPTEEPGDVTVSIAVTDSDGASANAECVLNIVAPSDEAAPPEEEEVGDSETPDTSDPPQDDGGDTDDTPPDNEVTEDGDEAQNGPSPVEDVSQGPPGSLIAGLVTLGLIGAAVIGLFALVRLLKRRAKAIDRPVPPNHTPPPPSTLARARIDSGQASMEWPDGPNRSWTCRVVHERATTSLVEREPVAGEEPR